uniref:Uncharacterized protein n=1 Tax=Ditylum brightwellii TaxID=49249 RepID=A0A6V2I8B0_9STRA|mmetsp:Transcript_22120/g.29171  ORF Transcript_22120/g.29171 Transcript_22120/m.29171 type:complete len:119 (+) Transcript_22120:125-481(+)|eukprot:15345709-Ditylum_brightwellii.AAC.1
MKICQTCVSKTQPQGAQHHQDKGSDVDSVLSPGCRQSKSDEVPEKLRTLKDLNCDFVEMTTPKKNGQTRLSTEFHVIKFIPCFMKMLEERITDDLTDNDDNSEEEEEEEEGGEEVQFD